MFTTNSPTSLLDFIRRRVGVGELASASWSVGELVRRRVDWLPDDEVPGADFKIHRELSANQKRDSELNV